MTMTTTTIISIPTDKVFPSAFNRERARRYRTEAMEELQENIRKNGQIEPAIVRPRPGGLPGEVELVVGERRCRACEALGVELHVIVRELTDREVCNLMLSENLQRENMGAVEEAYVFADMLQAVDGAGKRIYPTMDDLLGVTGRQRKVIENRLRLLNCPAFLLEAIERGDAPARSGELVGRLVNAARREEAARRALKSQYRTGAMTTREVAEMLKNEFMVSLKGCAFDLEDADLVPVEMEGGVRVAGGACTDCPMLTGNDATVREDIFATAGGTEGGGTGGYRPNVCQSPDCYERKQKAHWRREEKAAESNGFRLMPKDRAARLLQGRDAHLDVYVLEGGRYIAQDERPGHEHTGHFANDGLPTWAELLEGVKMAWIVVRDGRRVRYFMESGIAMETVDVLRRKQGQESLWRMKRAAGAAGQGAGGGEEEDGETGRRGDMEQEHEHEHDEEMHEPWTREEENTAALDAAAARREKQEVERHALMGLMHQRLLVVLEDEEQRQQVSALYLAHSVQRSGAERVLEELCRHYGLIAAGADAGQEAGDSGTVEDHLTLLVAWYQQAGAVQRNACLVMVLVRQLTLGLGLESEYVPDWLEVLGIRDFQVQMGAAVVCELTDAETRREGDAESGATGELEAVPHGLPAGSLGVVMASSAGEHEVGRIVPAAAPESDAEPAPKNWKAKKTKAKAVKKTKRKAVKRVKHLKKVIDGMKGKSKAGAAGKAGKPEPRS